jgi:predicted Zn-dependent protease
MTRRAILAAWLCLAMAGGASAQITAVPKELVIYAHQDLQADEIVRQLVCDLSAELTAPVHAETLDLPIDLSLIADGNELNSERLIKRLYAKVAAARAFGTNTFVLLLIPYYLRHETTSTFGTTFGMPYNMGVVSIASLYAAGTDLADSGARKLVARRAYKVSLRYVVHMSGLWERKGCVLAYPYGLRDLDQKPAELCDDDRAVLVEAGVVRATPGRTCDTIASIR